MNLKIDGFHYRSLFNQYALIIITVNGSNIRYIEGDLTLELNACRNIRILLFLISVEIMPSVADRVSHIHHVTLFY